MRGINERFQGAKKRLHFQPLMEAEYLEDVWVLSDQMGR